MIIIASKEGQFANRVLHFSHILAFCKENGISLYHPFFKEYYSYFPNLHENKNVRFTVNDPIANVLFKLLILFVKMLLKLKIYNLGFFEVIFYERYEQGAPVYDLSHEGVAGKASKKIVVLWGWLFRDQANFERQESYIRKSFAILDSYQQRVGELLAPVRKKGSTLVGVHIRRGDYRRFENGRWYYEDEVYREKMEMLKEQLEERGQRAAFILCSNEPLDLSSFENLEVYHFRDDFIIDFLLLSECDYITGPPSTFSALASFYGKKPLQFISERHFAPNLSHFSVCQHL